MSQAQRVRALMPRWGRCSSRARGRTGHSALSASRTKRDRHQRRVGVRVSVAVSRLANRVTFCDAMDVFSAASGKIRITAGAARGLRLNPLTSPLAGGVGVTTHRPPRWASLYRSGDSWSASGPLNAMRIAELMHVQTQCGRCACLLRHRRCGVNRRGVRFVMIYGNRLPYGTHVL